MTNMVLAPVEKPLTRPRLGDWVFALVALAFFTVGYVAAEEWPFRAALFPQIVSAAGLLLTLVKLVGMGTDAVRHRRGGEERVALAVGLAPGTVDALDGPAVHPLPGAPAEGVDPTEDGTLPAVALIDDEAESDEGMEYVFATAGARAWVSALGWIVLFFVSLVILGVFITVPLFALAYLRIAGGASWLSAGLYAAITGTIIYVVFRELLYIPLPNGIFEFLQV